MHKRVLDPAERIAEVLFGLIFRAVSTRVRLGCTFALRGPTG
jgi:hypothetical protein